jgi:hypothetical protein
VAEGVDVIQVYVSREWYWPHAQSVIKALGKPVRVHTPPRMTCEQEAHRFGIDVAFTMPDPKQPVVVWSGNDMNVAERVILMDHGVGQSYRMDDGQLLDHPSWAGGKGRDNAILFVVPNEYAANANRETYPHIPNAIIGSPHVEYLRTLPYEPKYRVCFSRHWGPAIVPEMKSAWWHYEEAITEYARAHPGKVALHCHPRQEHEGRRCAQIMGVPYIGRFEDVVRHCEVYVADNTSTIFEFAAMDRPVVLLTAPWFKNSNHGGRFGRWRLVGHETFCPDDLRETIEEWAVGANDGYRDTRMEIVGEAFPTIEGAAKLAAEAIEGAL